ncbi:MHFG family PEP-CTERM protein [Janthinobacterium sp.]|uniref:MHFG family PEP-CTERM protein n=1 Tax=Janthinobacterium sp. TaxID=1871054 RepID=UPI00293D595A|nr:MHFG family PEP-CTERM protein [Janthinobacterium sp.]
MISNRSSFPLFRRLLWIFCALGMLLGAVALTPLTAQAKGAARPDVLDNCDWNRPGVNPFMGDVVGAVDRYSDIPQSVRERLKQRMRERNYDEFVTISRDAISGKDNYDARISDMHFGPGRVCRQVSRAGWSEQMRERGMVYCEQGHCILVPTVCRNVSRITRLPKGPAGAPGVPGANAGMPDSVAQAPHAPLEELHAGSLNGAEPPGVVPGEALNLPGLVNSAGFSIGPVGGGSSLFSGNPGDVARKTVTTPSVQLPLSPVPEPATWGMLLAGLAMLALLARRRRA